MWKAIALFNAACWGSSYVSSQVGSLAWKCVEALPNRTWLEGTWSELVKFSSCHRGHISLSPMLLAGPRVNKRGFSQAYCHWEFVPIRDLNEYMSQAVFWKWLWRKAALASKENQLVLQHSEGITIWNYFLLNGNHLKRHREAIEAILSVSKNENTPNRPLAPISSFATTQRFSLAWRDQKDLFFFSRKLHFSSFLLLLFFFLLICPSWNLSLLRARLGLMP